MAHLVHFFFYFFVKKTPNVKNHTNKSRTNVTRVKKQGVKYCCKRKKQGSKACPPSSANLDQLPVSSLFSYRSGSWWSCRSLTTSSKSRLCLISKLWSNIHSPAVNWTINWYLCEMILFASACPQRCNREERVRLKTFYTHLMRNIQASLVLYCMKLCY